jgi:hypothetical protein
MVTKFLLSAEYQGKIVGPRWQRTCESGDRTKEVASEQ